MTECRHLVVVLGDQLDRGAAAFDGFDAARDVVWMAETSDESTHVWSSQQRITLFLAAMRHFAQSLRDEGLDLDYQEMLEGTLGAALADAVRRHRPQRVLLTLPGEWRVLEALRAAVGEVPLELRDDRHFLSTPAEFAAHAEGRKQLRMEYFYREMRRRHNVLMDDDAPAGGVWNFDAENRAAFGAGGPGLVPPTPRFAPDAITQRVIDLVRTRFARHPGGVDRFGWPVTRVQALRVLQTFIDERLEHFGRWQDAMWSEEPWLYHAQIAAAMNLKLLHPREVIAAAEDAYRGGRVPLPAVEGFIRQVLGWREYVRGVYWLKMPGYAELNTLDARHDLPAWYWTGETSMRGIMASKPYAATGKYIDRQSDYCRGCRFDPAQRTGDTACPFTTLYWDFLARHQATLARNPRMALQVKNLARIAPAEAAALSARAAAIRSGAVS